MDQLVPRIGEVRVELLMITGIFGGNLLISLIGHHRKISGQPPCVSMLAAAVFCPPLIIAIRTLHGRPLLEKRRLEEIVIPSRRRSGPRAFKARGDGVRAQTSLRPVTTSSVGRASSRMWCRFEKRTFIVVWYLSPLCALQVAIAMCPAQRVTSADQRDGLTIAPAHPLFERVSDLQGAQLRGAIMHPFGIELRVTALQLRALGEDVNQAHGMACLKPASRLGKIALGMVRLVLLRPPETVLAG
mmetsp:Transcript_112092/g.316807  ORF Transcript_112092/g.316807 Transcript_112092/m.316807 type:complete len:244 (+) Transcript_112092:375-1106(+)